LIGPPSVQFNAAPLNVFVRGDFSERSTIPNARIERTALFVQEDQKSPSALRLSLWKRMKA